MGRVTTREQRAAEVAGQLRGFAARNGLDFRYYDGTTTGQKLAAVEALGPTPRPADVNEVMGNDGWTACRCHQCDERERDTPNPWPDHPAVVETGEAKNWESNTARLCPRCVTLACLSLVLHDLPAGKAADAGEMPPAVLADWITDNAAEVVQRLADALRGSGQ